MTVGHWAVPRVPRSAESMDMNPVEMMAASWEQKSAVHSAMRMAAPLDKEIVEHLAVTMEPQKPDWYWVLVLLERRSVAQSDKVPC